MSGFQFSLKGSGISKPGQKKTPFGLSRKPLLKTVAKNVLQTDEDDDEPTRTSIDAFNDKGALAGKKVVGQPEQLVIVPTILSTGLIKPEATVVANETEKLQFGFNMMPKPKKETVAEEEDTRTAEEIARLNLLEGKSVSESTGLVIEIGQDGPAENTEEDYDKVPVEQFGAALLRGMGWKGDKPKPSTEPKEVSHRQKGALLGIGSKPIEKEIEEELMGKRGTKLSVPLLRRDRITGEQLRFDS